MNAKFLKVAGVKSMDEFYTKYPDEDTFIAKCGAKIKKAYPGVKIPKDKAQFGALFGSLLGGGAASGAAGAVAGEAAGNIFQNGTFKQPDVGPSSRAGTGAGQFLSNLSGGDGVGGALKSLTGGNPIGMAVDIFQGFKAQKERVNQAKQNRQVTDHLKDATLSNKMYEQQNLQQARMDNYVRPEDNMMTGEELFPMYGVGTNVLARYGKKVKAQNGFLGTDDKNKEQALVNPEVQPHVYNYTDYDGDEFRVETDTTGLHKLDRNFYPYYKTKMTGSGAGYISRGVHDSGTAIDMFKRLYPNRKDKDGNLIINASWTFDKEQKRALKEKALNSIQDERGMNQRVQDNTKYSKPRIKAANGFLGTSNETWKGMGQQGLGALSQLGAQKLGIGDDMGSQIGGKIGSALGTATGIPGMDNVGQFVLGGIGDLLDGSDKKITRENNAANKNIQQMIGVKAGNYFQNQFSANAKDGIKAYGMGGDVETYGDGGTKPLSYNPYGGQTDMIHGPSHSNGGVEMNVNGQSIEAEGGEPMVRATEDESISIMGNLKVPKHIKGAIESFSGEKFSGSKFKNVTKSLAENENKTTKAMEKNTMKAEDYTPLNPLDRISLNTLDLNNKVADKKLQKLQVAKETLASVQEELNAQEETAKYGKKIYQDGGSAKPFKNVSKNNSGFYGDVSQEDFEKFKTVNSWYDFTDFDPTKRGDVTKFQEAYNAKTDGRNVKVDGKLGPQTASIFLTDPASSLNAKPINSEIKTDDIPVLANFSEGINKDSDKEPNKEPTNWLGGIGQLFRDTDAEAFDNSQLTPELWAMANNKLEPVQSQKYQPRLRSPYDISFQDQLNQNTSSARSAERMAANNPGMLANLKAQEYMADSKVLGEQFRQNQGFKDQVYSGNLATLNDANLKNLAIADTQYTRQEQAKSNTKATDFEAIKSMTDKRLKNRLENRTLQVMENMYDYRYGPGYRANYMGPAADFSDWSQIDPQSETIDTKTYDYLYDQNGRPVQKKVRQQGTPTKKVISEKGKEPSLAYNPFNGNMGNGGLVKKLKKYK